MTFIDKLHQLSKSESRMIIGLMSGTSMDGLDISLCKIEGFGVATKVNSIKFKTVNYEETLKSEIRKVFSLNSVDLQQVCLLNEHIGILHAQMINAALKEWGIPNNAVDLIASHGQTIYHSPRRLRPADQFGNGTLQIGDADHIAHLTGIITLSDFRQKHIAAGGEGAPLAIYGDYLLFRNNAENRIMLNIGGIANFTYLPVNESLGGVFSSDVGPGNTIMDQFSQKHFGQPADFDAVIAKQGTVNKALLNALLDHDFFEKDFPKTTGPELFNLHYLSEALVKSDNVSISLEDQLATLNYFSAYTISLAIKKCEQVDYPTIAYLSGGGIHNPLLIQNLNKLLPNVKFKNIQELGINPDEKEAILFALLANETICGSCLPIGSAKANPPVMMGKISLP